MFMLPFGLLIPDLLINFAWQIFAPTPATVLMRYYKENPLGSEDSYNALNMVATSPTNTTNVVMKGNGSSVNRVNPDVSDERDAVTNYC